MDQRLKEAIEYSNYRLTLATHKKNIRLRAEAIQLVSDSGGMFRSSEQLILWLDYLIRSGTEQYVLNDSNDQPVLVKDLVALHKKLADGHAKSMNLLHAENEKIKRARTIEKVVDVPKEVEKTETINEQSESSSTDA
jgi:hypothetical protein